MLRRNRPNPRTSSLVEALANVSPQVQRAVEQVHKALNDAKVPHLLIGGLAVGVHGYSYATQDVDFLVSDAAFTFTTSGLACFAPGVPFQASGVQIDYIGPQDPTEHLLLQQAEGNPDLNVVPVEVLIAMKLRAGRRKDKLAVVELIRAGANVQQVEDHLAQVAPTTLSLWRDLLREADFSEV